MRAKSVRTRPGTPYPLGATWDGAGVVLPAHQARVRWTLVLDTRQWAMEPRATAFRAGDQYPLESRSLALLRLRRPRSEP